MTTFEDAKVGDRAWDITKGWTEIKSINHNSIWPICTTSGLSYTFEGKIMAEDLNPSIFWDEIKFEIPPKPLPKLEVDTKVLVRDTLSSEPLRRYFSHFEKNGQIATFAEGRTSWSVQNKPTIVWEYWELAKG